MVMKMHPAVPAASTSMHDMNSMSHDHKHGSLSGHFLPGIAFIILGLWWFIHVVHTHRGGKGRKTVVAKFKGWCQFPAAQWFPLEPVLKIGFGIIGIMGELFFSHHLHWRTLYMPDGHLWTSHLNNWQHSVMYAGFMLSGAVDLLGTKFTLPHGTEQVFLALAFLSEATLMTFHIKGSALDREVHTLLAVMVFLCALMVLLEMQYPHSVLISTGRCWAVILQGTWWCQAGRVLFLNNPAWDDTEMGAAMFLPVLFILHALFVSTALLVMHVSVHHTGTHLLPTPSCKFVTMDSVPLTVQCSTTDEDSVA